MYEKNRILIAGVNSEEEFDHAVTNPDFETDKDLVFIPTNTNYGSKVYMGVYFDAVTKPYKTTIANYKEVEKEVIENE